MSTYLREKMESEKRVNSLEEQIAELERKLAADKDQLEKEIIARIDAENKFQTLKEESQFQAQVYKKEIAEARKASASAISIECTSSADYEGEKFIDQFSVSGIFKFIRCRIQKLRERISNEPAKIQI